MSRKISGVLGVSVLAAMLALGTGCASTKQLEEVRAVAEEAKAMAAEASSKADRATATAEEANRRSMDTDQKVDEMFKKAMTK